MVQLYKHVTRSSGVAAAVPFGGRALICTYVLYIRVPHTEAPSIVHCRPVARQRASPFLYSQWSWMCGWASIRLCRDNVKFVAFEVAAAKPSVRHKMHITRALCVPFLITCGFSLKISPFKHSNGVAADLNDIQKKTRTCVSNLHCRWSGCFC